MANAAGQSGRPQTRGVVLDLIRSAGTISRVELAAGSGLAGPTITQVVRELIDDGLVIEAGRGESTGGKPRTLLRLDPASRYAVGVQLDRCTSALVVVDLAGRPVARTSFGGSGMSPPTRLLPLLARHVESLLDGAGIDRRAVLGVGLVSHGPQDRLAGVLRTAQPTPEWQDYPVATRLGELLGLPVLLDHDATAAAVGEFWVGGVDPASTYGCIYLASGIGGGVVVEGEVYRGGSANGVEIGHLSLDVHGKRCGCGNPGCLEAFAGPQTVIDRARADADLATRLALTDGPADTVANFGRIAEAAAHGDHAARTLIEDSARYFGHAAVAMCGMFDLDLIVLAGPSFAAAGPLYRAGIQAQLDRSMFGRQIHPVRAVLSASGSDAAAVGGAVLVLRSELTPPGPHQRDGRALRYAYPARTAAPATPGAAAGSLEAVT
ncbi:ROK family transcriptional regulator [Micromonospora sp. NPDC000089]|uniref:ROK family transcriptional regulator n=1 Tax=unclassified Micromonospora TaxID=2617518 RepID=UPI0036CE3A38